MKPVFSSYILKRRAKEAMRGQLFRAFTIAVLPMLIVTLATVVVLGLIPDAREAFELAVNGQFETKEARVLYFDDVMTICMRCVNLLSALFAFLAVGAQSLFLDMLRGKEVKIKGVFRYFNRWHVALIYPGLTVAVTAAAEKMTDMLTASGMDANTVMAVAWILQLVIYFVAFRLMFVELALADGDCKSFADAVKVSWRITGVNTFVSFASLVLSFFGWVVAATFTAGMAFVYLIPYAELSIAALYEGVRSQERGSGR